MYSATQTDISYHNCHRNMLMYTAALSTSELVIHHQNYMYCTGVQPSHVLYTILKEFFAANKFHGFRDSKGSVKLFIRELQ